MPKPADAVPVSLTVERTALGARVTPGPAPRVTVVGGNGHAGGRLEPARRALAELTA